MVAVTRTPHPWAVLDGDTPLFHTPGSYPPEYTRDEALEALWRAKRTTMQPYYSAHRITIFNADCRALTLPEKPALGLQQEVMELV